MDENPTPPPPPARPARWKKVLLYGGGGLLLSLGILVALLPTLLSSDLVRGMAAEKASAAAGRKVGIGSHDVGWSETVVKDLEVRYGPGDADPILARVGEIRVPAGISLAFSSRYDVGTVEILRPEIRVDLREFAKKTAPAPDHAAGAPKGPAAAPGSPKEPSAIPPFSVAVKVREGSLVLVDLDGKERRLGAFSADLAASLDGPAEVSFTLDAGAGGKATFHAKTSPFRGGKPVPAEALEAAVSAVLENFDPGLDGFKGTVSADVSATASGDGSVRDGKLLLDVRGLSMEKVEEPEIHAEGSFSRAKDGTAEVRDGRLRMKGLEATASATLLPSGAVNGVAHATGALDLLAARAKRLGVPFQGYLVGDLVLDARAVSDAAGDRITGTFGVSGGQVAFGPSSPPIDEPEIRAEFDLTRAGKQWTVGALSLKASTADLSLTGTAMQDLSAADLRARAKVRLGPALRIAKAFGTPLPGEVTGDLDLDATLRRSGKEGDEAKGTLVITDLAVLPPGEGAKPVREARLSAEFEAVPGKENLEVRRLSWKGAGAEVRVAGTARMDGASGELSTCEADLDLAKAAALAAAFGSPLPVGLAGSAGWKGTVSWKDTFGTVAAAGTVLVRDLAVTLPGDRVLREAEVRAGVDAAATKAAGGYGVALRGATLAARGIDLSALGSAGADGTLDLAVKGTASIPEALRRAAEAGFLAKDPSTRGTVAFDLGVKGRPGDLRAEVRLLEARDAEFDLRASGAVEEKGAADLALEAGGDVAVLVDLATRAGLLQPVKGAAGKATLRGTVQAAGPAAPLRLALTGGVEGLSWPDPAGGPPWTQKGVKAVLAFDLDRTSMAASGTADLRADDGGLVITGTLDLAEGKRRLDAKGDVDFDAGGFCRSRPDLLPLPDMTVGRVKGGFVVKTPLATPFDLAGAEGGARLVLDSVKTEPLELKDAAVDLFLRGGALEARSISGTVNGGKVAGSAGLGLSGEGPKHFLDLRGEGIRIDPAMNFILKRAVPLFVVGDGGGVEGTLKFAVRLDATGKEWLEAKKSLAGKGSLTVTDGSVVQSGILGDILELLDGGKGLSFSSVTTEFSVHDRRVWNDRMLVDGKEHAMVISGSTAFNGELDYKIGAKGLRLPKRTLERIQPLLDAEGNLPFTLKGNFAKPKVKGPDLKKALKGLLGGKDD